MKPEDMDKIWPEMASNYTRGYEGEGWEDRPVTFALTEKGEETIRQYQKQRAINVILVCLIVMVIGIIYIYIR